MTDAIPQMPSADVINGAARQFRADVLRGLGAAKKELPCKYFYDEAGSALFEQITELDEYYPTRTELGIMERHAAEMAGLLGPRCLLIEYGSGSSLKTRYLLDRLRGWSGGVELARLLPPAAEQARRYRGVATPFLSEAAEAGGGFYPGGTADIAQVDGIAPETAEELAWGTTAGWLMRCPLDFPEAETA